MPLACWHHWTLIYEIIPTYLCWTICETDRMMLMVEHNNIIRNDYAKVTWKLHCAMCEHTSLILSCNGSKMLKHTIILTSFTFFNYIKPNSNNSNNNMLAINIMSYSCCKYNNQREYNIEKLIHLQIPNTHITICSRLKRFI